MPDWSFLDQPQQSGDWEYEPVEHRDCGLFDSDGKRIGFQIQRSFCLRPGIDQPHVRWVAVTKDGEWLRNDCHSYHATYEEAEAEVERRIGRSLARYARLAAERGVVSTGDFDFSRPRVVTGNRARPKVKTFTQSLDDAQRGLDGCAKQLYGCGCLLVLLGLLGLSPFILAML